MNKQKLLLQILNNQKNVNFNDFVALVEAFGFLRERVVGSHNIFTHAAIPEFLNIQNDRGKAKSYQINQFLTLIEKHDLGMED